MKTITMELDEYQKEIEDRYLEGLETGEARFAANILSYLKGKSKEDVWKDCDLEWPLLLDIIDLIDKKNLNRKVG